MYVFSPFVVALVAVFSSSSGSSNINFANAQTLAGKWALQNPTTTFVAETNTFALIFDIDASIAQGNTVSAVYDKDCLEGSNELLVADGIDEKATVVATSGTAAFSFNLNTDILRLNTKVFSPDTPTPGFAEMKICARFMLQTDDASYEVNFIETVITVIFDLQAGFVIDFSAENKAVIETVTEKDYGAEAYLCDPSFPDIRLPSYALTQGGTISVCVLPNEDAINDGLFLRSVDEFKWVRGAIEQPAIENGASAGNQLTRFECAPGSESCSFVSILYGDFFEPPTPPPTIAPTQIPSTSPSSYPTRKPTSAPILAPTMPDWPVESPTSSIGWPTATQPQWPTYSQTDDMPPFDQDDWWPEPTFDPYYVTIIASDVPTSSPTICTGGLEHSVDTNLDFTQSVVLQNDLNTGGELRYGNIGQVRGNDVDLVVTATDYQNDNTGTGKNPNGVFGKIGLTTVEGDPSSGEGTFQFCFVEPNTNRSVTVESFQWTIFDLDNRGTGGDTKKGIHEKMIMDTSQAYSYSVWPNSWESEVHQSCENSGVSPPCAAGERTVFAATEAGQGEDNPSSPNDLTDLQKKRSVTFTFENTNCWTMVYNAFCPYESYETCHWYGGSNFLFGGGAQQIIEEGETTCFPANGYPVRNLVNTEAANNEAAGIGSDSTQFGASRSLVDDASKSIVAGLGSATLQFGGSRRLEDGRALQDDTVASEIGMSITVSTTEDDGPYRLRTAGGASLSATNFISILGLLVNAVLLLLS